jgi:Sugar phosphate isomerases/epimerases
MFIAASTQCFSDLSFEEACKQLTDLEYEKVEFFFDAAGTHLNLDETIADVEGFVAKFRDKSRLLSVAIDIEAMPTDAQLEGVTKIAKALKITQITIPSAELGTPFNSELDRLKRNLLMCSQEGIRLSIRTTNGCLTEDPHTAVELCQAVKGLGLTLDPSYYLTGPSHTQNLDKLYPYTYHAHLRDSLPDQFQIPVGLGEIDYSRIMTGLKKFDYQRILSVCLHPQHIAASDRPLEMRKMRMLLDSMLI